MLLSWNDKRRSVAPFAGAWIEIKRNKKTSVWIEVAPFAGAWIEIYTLTETLDGYKVAPFAGAWIEINV